MRYLLASMLAALVLLASTATAPSSAQVYTQPSLPDPEALQALNLKLGWQTYIPMDGRRDSLFSIQHAGDSLLIQTRSGLVCAVDAETGQIRWQARLGRPYRTSVPLGYNTQAVYVVNDQTLIVLDRQTGQFLWDFDMPSAATAAPVADDDQVFLSLEGGRLSAYSIPNPKRDAAAKKKDTRMTKAEKVDTRPESARPGGAGVGLTSSIGALASATGRGTRALVNVGPLSTARQVSQSATSGTQLRLDWSDASGLHLDLAPLQTHDTLLLVGGQGRIVGLGKGLARSERYNLQLADDAIIVQPSRHEEEAYIASQDSNLYAVRIPSGSVHWRFTTGTPISRQPAVTDADVFITTERAGLRRLDRTSGEERWQNQTASRFLAENARYVYATDPSGRLLLLDRGHGTRIGTLDTRDFVVPIANEITDRVYLAANNGLLICLHDRDCEKPQFNRSVETKKPEKITKTGKKSDRPAEKPKPKTESDEGDSDKKPEGGTEQKQ
jgi:outer membrane protein assembly factor BamB